MPKRDYYIDLVNTNTLTMKRLTRKKKNLGCCIQYYWNPGLYIMSNNFRHREGSVRMFGSGPNMDEVLKSKIVDFI